MGGREEGGSPAHVISLSDWEGSQRANITHCIPFTFLPSLGAPGQNKTFSETLMFREVRTGELENWELERSHRSGQLIRSHSHY